MTRYSSNFRLFNGFKELGDVKEDHINKVDREFRDVSADELIESSESEFVDDVMDTVSINKPEIDLNDWEAETEGSGGSRRLRVPLLVRGDVDLLEINPSGYQIEDNLNSDNSGFDLSSMRNTPTLDGRRLIFSFSLNDREPSEIEEEVDETIEEVREGLDALHSDIEDANEDIREYASQKYNEKKEQAEKNEDKLDELDIPIKDRDED